MAVYQINIYLSENNWRQSVSSFLANPNPSGVITAVGFAETYVAASITSNVLTIDLSKGTVFNVTNNANITTFTILNAPAGLVSTFTIFFKANGSTFAQTWGASVLWSGGTPPALTATNNKVDSLSFMTNDGGTTWFGFVGGQNF